MNNGLSFNYKTKIITFRFKKPKTELKDPKIFKPH